MKRRPWLISLVLFVVFPSDVFANRISKETVGGNVEWMPYTAMSVPVAAGFTPTGLPVVLFNPRITDSMRTSVVWFLAWRQDEVASLLEQDSDTRDKPQLSGNYAGRSYDLSRQGLMQLLPESAVYRNPALQPDPEAMLSCLAWNHLSAEHRAEIQAIVMGTPPDKQAFMFSDRLRPFGILQLMQVRSPQCAEFSRNYRR